MRFTDIFIRRPVLATVVSLIILLAGLQAIRSLNVRQYPLSENATITVMTVYVGASADLVRGFVTQPLERAIAGATAGLRVHLSPATADMEGLRRRLRPADSGAGGEIILVAGVGEGREVELKLPGRFSLDPAVRGALKTAPGVAFLEEV